MIEFGADHLGVKGVWLLHTVMYIPHESTLVARQSYVISHILAQQLPDLLQLLSKYVVICVVVQTFAEW